jgi:hypothetical protein
VNTQDPNPYATPNFVDEVVNYGPVEMARRSLSRPATAIVIMASVHSVFDSLLLANLVVIAFRGVALGSLFGALLIATCGFGIHVFQCICAAKMGRLESFRLAVAGCVLSAIPFLSPLYYLGIPFAIWGIILLRKPAIKEAFEAARLEKQNVQRQLTKSVP